MSTIGGKASLLATSVVVSFVLLGSTAHAVPIHSFSAVPSSTSTQAGAHPDVSFSFEIGNRLAGEPDPCTCKDARNITVHLPPGLIGNPHATPQCSIAQFASSNCPPDSQVGATEDQFRDGPPGGGGFGHVGFASAIYNLTPPPEQPALFAFETVINTPVFINITARTESDYGIDAVVSNINHVRPLEVSRNVFWGVPAANVHTQLRFGRGELPLLTFGGLNLLCSKEATESTDDPATMYGFCADGFGPNETYGSVGPVGVLGEEVAENGPGFPVKSNSPEIPFFQNPTTCDEPSLATSLDILGFDDSVSHADSAYPPTIECSQLTFNPSQAINPTTTAADSPSGAEFRLTVPQFESPAVPSPSELRAATVTFPQGFTLAPNVTNGKETCSDAQARFGTREEAQCPENSKVGTVSVETPVLPGLLPGAIYLGEPKPGNRFRVVLAFNGFGVHVKLPGTLTPDPASGQIVIRFQDLPQAPFASFNAHFFGSERGPLDTPTQCGKYEVSSEWTPWDSALANQVSRQFFTVDRGPNGRPCPGGPRPFAPSFQAASAANTAGAHAGFSLNLTREDGDQNLAAVNVTTPPGFTATLKGLTYCPEAAIALAASQGHLGVTEQATPSCPASSYVGEIVAGAGPGTHPLFLPGKAYLAGAYKGAPMSFVFITPAVSAGYDLGDVVIRAALQIDPETAQVTAVSDPLPQIFEGIPLRLRSVMINLNRPNFTLNPTNCEPLAITARLFGDEDALANLSQHFQVANCASLPFGPKLSLELSGGVRRRGHPAIHAILRTQPGEANPRTVSLTLPPSELLDNAHIDTICTRADFANQSCPAGSLIGHATVSSPLLDQPLRGSAYLRSSGNGLPDLALDLHGQFHIITVARIDAVSGGLRTTFQTIPDVPLGTVSLDLRGGSKGLIQNSESLCGGHYKADLKATGQNGASLHRRVPLKAICGSKQRHKSHKRGGRR